MKIWKNKKLWLLVGLVAGASILLFKPDASGSGNATQQFAKVERSNLEISLSESGSLQALKQVAIKNWLPKSKILYIIPEGTVVKEGDLLVELDAEEMTRKKEEVELKLVSDISDLDAARTSLMLERSTVQSEKFSAEQQVLFAKMDLEKFEELDEQQQLDLAQSNISQALDNFKLAEQRFEWTKQLVEKGYETKSQSDRDSLDLSSKKKALDTAHSKLEMLKRYDLPKKKLELKSKLVEAEKKLERTIKQGESKVVKAESLLRSRENKLKHNQERLDEILETLESAKIHAPVDGLVLYSSDGRYRNDGPIEEGASVRVKETIINIPENNGMKVVVSVPEFHIHKVKLKQAASVTIDSLPNKKIKAHVSKIGALPKRQSWFSTGTKFYNVEVTLDEPLENVKPSVSAKADIEVASLKDVLNLPVHALREEDGKLYCYVKKGLGGLDKVFVEVGQMSNTHAEVLSGLESGDQVLLSEHESN